MGSRFMPCAVRVLIAAFALAVFGGLTRPTDAFQVKRVIRGNVALATADEVKTSDLTALLGGTPIDLTKAFILAKWRSAETDNQHGDVFVTIDDPSTVLVARRAATLALTVEFMIVEFVDGVTVQSGLTTLSELTTTKNVVLPSSVDTTKSFPLVTWRSFNANNTNNQDERNTYTANLTAANNLQLVRTEGASGYVNDIAYQVISFDADVTVTTATVTMNGAVGAGETSDNGTVLVAALSPTINTAKSMLFFTSRPSTAVNGVESAYKVDGQIITANNTITFTRTTNTGTVTIIYYVLEFSNEMFVQHGRNSGLTNATASTTFNLGTATTLERTAAAFSVSGGSGVSSELDDDAVTGQLSFSSPNLVVTLARVSTANTVPVSYNASEYPPVNLSTLNSAGSIWRVGESHPITWSHADDVASDTAKLELSMDGGSTWQSTAITCDEGARTIGSDLCTWTIPATLTSTTIGAALRIKLSDTGLSARNFDVNNANFEIKGSVTLTAPNGGEVWGLGSTQNVTWTRNGDMSYTTFTLEYSDDGSFSGGAHLTSIASGLAQGTYCSGNSCTYSWTIASSVPVSEAAKVRVSIASDASNVFDVSNASFALRGSITATYPNGGETLETQKSYNITWNKSGSFTGVDLYYSKNSGGSYSLPNGDLIATNQAAGVSSGAYSWTVPTSVVSSFVRVKVMQNGNSNVSDECDADFSVVPSVTVTAPNGGDAWLVGETRNITWTTNGAGLANVKIEYSTDGGTIYNPIVENDGAAANDGIVTNNGSRAWDVPDQIGGNLLIKISNPSNAAINDVSDAVFRIKGVTQIVAPNGGEVWPIGGSRTILWNNTGTFTGTVEIRYSLNGGSGFPSNQTLVTGYPNSGASGSYSWNPISDVAGGINNTMRIRVIPSDSTNVAQDDSDANFSVKGTLTLSAPNGGQSWVYGGAAQNIAWTHTGSIGSVELRLSTNSGSSFGSPFVTGLDVTAGTPYAWTIPDNLTTGARIRVQLVSDTSIYDDSDSDFIIKGSLALTVPDGGETWYIGDTTNNITWTRSGTTGPMTGNVDIYYSTDNWGSQNLITGNAILASAGLFNWNPIPGAAQGDSVKMKIQLTSDTSTQDFSGGSFAVKPKITVTAPDGAEVWKVGETNRNITWSTTGTVSQVSIYRSANGGVDNYPTLVAGPISNVNSYAWNPIPDIIGTQVRIKVTHPTDSLISDASNADFEVRGSLTLTVPNGSESWIVGGSENVTWTKTGTLSGNVKLYYSTNGGSTYIGDPASPFAIVPVTDLSYAWTVPDAIGTQLRVKIVYANDTNVTDESDANFTVKGSLALTAPNGGEVWPAGQTRTITWTKTGTLANVKLEYGTDGGTSYPTVVSGLTAASNLSFDWAIPSNVALTTTGRVKITLLSDSSVNDASDNDFRVRGDVALTAPNGGQTWVVGATQNVTWTIIGAIANVKLEYSTDSGANYLAGGLITASTPAAAGSFPWTVGDGISGKIRVKVSDASDAAVYDESDLDNTIKGSLTITAPNGGQSWVVGTSENITWTKTGTIPNVKLVYSTDAGLSYPEVTPNQVIVASTPGANLSYAWTIPDAIGSQLRVKIIDLGAVAADADESNANFGIKGAIALTAPNGSEQWGIGTPQSITWNKQGSLTGNLKLELSRDAGTSWLVGDVITSTAPASGASYSWTVPDAPTIQARVRVTQLDDTSVTDTSDANFRIKGSLSLTAPNGSENWKVGESRNVTWTRGGSIVNVKLDYSTDSGATFPGVIVASTPGANLSYAWTVPSIDSAAVRVKVEDAADDTVTDTSNADFTVKPTVTLTAPNGGQSWLVGTSQSITWTKAGTIANVKLEYSTDAGVTYPGFGQVIVASTPGSDLSYAWTIPDAIGAQLRVKITKTDDSGVTDESDGNFSIKGSLAVVSPNGGESWVVNSSHAITWTRVGTTGEMAGKVDLTYSVDGGTNYSANISINTVDASALTYSWTIPDAIGTQLRVKAALTGDASVTDASNANFTVKGALALTAPNGAEVWAVASSQNVTWTRTGSITNVKLVYSTDGGGTFPEALPDNTIVGSTDASTGTYAWSIPDRIGNLLRVRVYDASDATVYDDSNANFKIVGGLTVTAPNGGEKWPVNTNQTVTWSRTGTVANVKIEYSTDGGLTYPNPANLIIASTPGGNLSYTWTIPDSPTATARIKILDASDLNVYDVSDANFKIRASVTVTAPDGGEVWTVGSGQTISWTNVGTIANAKVEYSTDGGSTYPNLITASTANTGAYSWTVPDAIATTVRVKVTDAADADAFDSSNANFKIRGGLALTAPNGGEQWNIAAAQNIAWTRTGSITNVKLVYSIDSGLTYPEPANVIIASTPGVDLSYSWTIPDKAGTALRVRILDAADPTVVDDSNADFSIKGVFTVTAPNGGESWIVGSSHNITWTTGGTVANVAISYSTDGGTNFTSITNSTANTGSYAWTIPDAIGSTVKVKVADALDANASDLSNANFTIKGSLTLTAPNGAEVWTVNDSQNITWTRTGTIANVKLEYSANAFADELQTTVITNSTAGGVGSFAWTIPDAIGIALRVRITNTADATVTDNSDADFTIKGALTLTAPNGGESWIVNGSQSITWTKQGSIANVKLEYSKNAFSDELQTNTIIASTAAGPLSYSWTVADAIGTNLKVRVSDVLDGTVKDISNSTFVIKGALVLTAPNGGESWTVLSSQNITWTRTGTITAVKLEYATDGGSVYSSITLSTDGSTGTYAWTIPDAISATSKVKVTDANDGTVSDESNAVFKIVGGLALTAPNGGEKWVVGTAQSITWIRTGTVANVKLEYSTDGGSTYPNLIIASTGAAAQSYSWAIPNTPSATVRVKVSDASDSSVSDTSDASFKIRASVTVTAPDGGEVWTVGSGQTISWGNVGTVANVKIDYSTNGGSTFPNPVIASTANTGSYSWTVPDAIGTTLRVQVSDAGDSDAVDASNANFRIRGAVAVTAPNGGEQWNVASSQNITWTRTGTIANVKLVYSTDSGLTYPEPANVIIASTLGADLSYAWTVPDKAGTALRVRVYDASDASVYDDSNSDFSIKGVFTVTAPNGGETWVVGASQNITWTTGGTVANVKLSYSTDGGITYPNTIVASTANAGTYAWTIPDAVGSLVRVKAADALDANASDASNANFTIKGSLTVTAPNGAEVWIVNDSQNITWAKTGTIANVKLEYSTNAFADETQTVAITASTAGASGTYAWTIPDAIGSAVRVRITNAGDASVADVSDANFTIKGSVTVTSPDGGESWIVGTSQNVTWTKQGAIANVKLEYSKNAFSDELQTNTIIASTPAAALSYAWAVSDAIGTNLKVRVSDASDSTVKDVSNAAFVVKGALTLTAPNGGESWTVLTSHAITWTRTGTITAVKLEYSTNGGSIYNSVTASTDGSTGTYAWTIPDAIGATTKVRVTDANDGTVSDESNAVFKIVGGVALTAPNGGEKWVVATAQSITWIRTGSVANVKLEYSTDGGLTYPNLIIGSTGAALQSYSWTIPNTPSAAVRVRVSDASDASVNDFSDANWKIRASITVTAPDGGEVWTVGSGQTISWTNVGTVANAKIDYSTDGGSNYSNAVAASTPNTGAYSWTVPDAISTTVRVQVTDAADSDAFDTSNANFKIRGALALTAPNGGEQWNIGSVANITWTRTGSVSGVKLVYSTDSGLTYPEPANVIIASTPGADLTYAWMVPDRPSTAVRVRILDASDSSVLDDSNGDFSIKGAFALTSPNGGETWVVGSSHNVTWTTTGTIANVKLTYSTDSGSSFQGSISNSTSNTGSFSWTVADAIGTGLRVKVEDVLDANAADSSNADFTIKGSLALTAPNGGESLTVNGSQSITWTKTGTIPNVKLEYSTDGGLTYPGLGQVIVASTPGATLSYAWTVADAIGSQLRIKVSNGDDSSVNDQSDANFAIKGAVTLTSPDGGETWVVAESHAITWTKQGSIANVKLEYSKNGFADELQTFTIIGSTAAAPLSYAWTVADAIGSNLKVRVSDASDAAVSDVSNAAFTVKGALSLTAPNGGEAWTVQSSRNITWTRTGSITNVKLEYSTDGGTIYVSVAASTDASTGAYAWTIPDAISSTVKVRVSDTTDAAVNDESNANFKIVGGLALTAPNGGEKWTVGASQNITWTRTGSIANVALEYSTDGGASYTSITASTGAAVQTSTWTIPNAPSATVKVRVSDASDSSVNDASDADFKIKAAITVTAPDGGEVWTVGAAQSVTWGTVGTVNNVKIDYSNDGGSTFPFAITASAPNTGSYSWTVADVISTSVRIRVTDAADVDAFDSSNGNFKVRGALLLTAPNGGEQWGISQSKNITWARTGSITNVKLEYSTNGFFDETATSVIVASTGAALGTYAWTIPDFPGVSNKVRVTDASDPTVLDTSNATFSIKGSLFITAPNGGETWIVGSDYNITWTKFGSISNVEVRYSTNSGATWPSGKIIVASTSAAAGTYTWTIPDDISNSVLVRVTDTNDTSVLDDSDAAFSVKGSLTVISPNGSEVWIVGDSQNITWTKTGTIPTVKLEYSKNGFSDETQVFSIINSVASSPATYAWTIPDAISSAVKVRISNTADALVKDLSDADFAIKGSLVLNAPNGGEVWTVASSQAVTWSRVGSIANVALDYSTDGGVSYPTSIVGTTAAAAGSFSWTVPDAITTTARVRVSNTLDAAVNDASNGNFKIAGSVTLTAPNGGEAWLIAGVQNITWTKQGSIASVKLEYSTDSGSTFPNVIAASLAASDLSYAWTIPDAPTTAARVKISNVADATIFDASNGDFGIRGTLTIASPNGGEVWVVGESRAITWTKQGSIGNVELRYSTNSGSSYVNVITASTAAGALTYAWTVPDAISSTMRVKITDITDSAVTDASDADFKVKGAVTLAAPNGAETWIVGATQNVTWTHTGSFANVKLDYSTDGGLTFPNVITASAAAAPLSFAWTVPDAIGTTLRVQVSDAADSTVSDASDNNFSIKGSLTINAPNGGETWIVGDSQNITWAKTGTLNNAKLEYSTNGGVSFPNVISASTAASALSYAWTIPDSLSTAVRVKITDLDDATVNDASDANVKIAGSLTVTSPNGGETWIVGSTNSITWTKTGSIASARLDYSTNGGVSFPNVITNSVSAGALAFLWTVPDNISSSIKVKIEDLSDASVSDISNADFKIAGSFTVTSPNGGEKWAAGSTQSINWTKTGSIVNAKIEFSTDGGSTFPNLVVATTPAANLSYAWSLGSTTTTLGRVRVADVSDATVNDISNANFKVMGGFTLTAPNGGEVWVVGASQNITWNTAGSVANVKLSYSQDGGTTYPNVIGASTSNSGSFSWTIPDAIGTTLRVKVEDVLDPDAFDESDANFKIKGSLTVTAPNGGEIWTVDSSNSITWTKTGSISNIKIEYSTDGGTNYPPANLIVGSVIAGGGSYAWTIPDAITTTVRVRITDLNDATVFDASNNNFTIRGSFTLTAPNGGEKWKVASIQPITWTTFGTIANVRLEYSTDAGVNYTAITASTANSGTYNWTLPNAISATARVRVLNAADTGTFDVSNADFKIMANFAVTAPNGGEVLVAGASYSVTWTTGGTVSNVKLDYSINSGTNYPNTVIASTSNTGIYSWTVPDNISSTLRVRVADVTDSADAFDTSDADFKIRAGFTVTAPNGGEAWAVGTAHNVTWTTNGTVSNVKLEYSTDGGSIYSNIVASVANAGTYAWTIPDAITTAGRVRVSDINDITASDTSNLNFKIQGVLTLTAPNGGEKWTVNTVHSITWDRQGSIPNVKLDFSTNGGSIYAAITALASNTGSYAWTIPDSVSTNCLVKIADANDPTVTDVADAAFKIQAGFVITAPNGGEVWGIGSNRNITWTTNGTVSFVKLDYSSDSGASYSAAITTSTDNTGTYSWTVPDVISGTMRIKVSQTTDAEAFDTSDGNFRIRAIVGLVAPNGAEVWRVGQSRNITWTVSGTIPAVRLQYSRDGFNVDVQNINASAPQSGSFAWTVPDSISNTVRVRVSDSNDIGAFDDSNADFRIIANFTVISPNGSEQWTVASAQTITWTSAGSVPNVKLEYSANSGGSWTAILGSTPNDGSQAWMVPDAISANVRVRVSDPADSTSDDMSDNDLKIKSLFGLTAPNGGEIWTVSQVQNVTWTNTGTVPNVKLTYSTNGGGTFGGTIAASTANTGIFAWTVPDSISTNVQVKVESTTDGDAFDTSDADFKIRGDLGLTSPNGGEAWGIAQNKSITWTTTGTVPNVKLAYSTDGGSTFGNVITASVANANTYTWSVSDTPSTQARVRVENVADSTVFDDSNANFSMQGNFTLTSPNGGEAWAVNGSRAITWNWGGTIPNVKLTYSTDSGSTYPNLIAAAAPNGGGSSGTFSYAWSIPDAISNTVRVKVEDANDAAVFDASNADFKIQAGFNMVAPNGGERWVVNESRTIQWTTGGTVPLVKLEYSTDGGSIYANTIVASTANTGTYSWTIPNTTTAQARVRVTDTNDAAVFDTSDANFTIDLYQITINVKDLLSNNPLDQMTVNGSDNSNPAYTWAASGLTSPIVKGLQYGTWPVTFTRVEYGDQTVNIVVDRDQTVNVFMETQVVHIWEAVTEIAYNTDSDTVSISSTLRRDGSIVTGVTSCAVKFYDGSTLIKTLSNSGSPDANGFYGFTWAAPTGLVAGKVYNVVTTATIVTGGTFNTPRTFNITDVKKLKDLETTVNSKLNVDLVTLQGNLRGDLSAQTATIRSDLAAQTGAINTSLTAFETKSNVQINALKLRADEIKNAGSDLEKSSEELNATNAKFSGSLILPSNVLLGDKNVKLQYRAISGLVPLITVAALDVNNKSVIVINSEPMTADSKQADMYEYVLDKVNSPPYTPGKAVSVVVEASVFKYELVNKEPVKNIEAGSFIVESTTLSTLEGLVAGNSTSAIKEMMSSVIDAVRGVEASFAGGGSVISALDNLNRKVDRIPGEIAKIGKNGLDASTKDTINEIATRVKTFAGDSVGADLTAILGKALDESASMKEIRKKSDIVQGSIEITQQLMEQKLGGIDDPVVHAIYQ